MLEMRLKREISRSKDHHDPLVSKAVRTAAMLHALGMIPSHSLRNIEISIT